VTFLSALLLLAGALAAAVVYLAATRPSLRRPQFRDAPPWPKPVAFATAFAVFLLFAAAAWR